jgi:hypothetical protein
MSWQNQHYAFATSMDPDQPAHPRSLIRIHAVRLQTLKQVKKLIANSMDPDQTVRMRRLVWIHVGRKPIMLVLSWHGSYICCLRFEFLKSHSFNVGLIMFCVSVIQLKVAKVLFLIQWDFSLLDASVSSKNLLGIIYVVSKKN